MQIQAAYDYMVKYADQLDHNVRYEVTVDTKHRGVYLRELHQQLRPREMIVNVEPKFTEKSRKFLIGICFFVRLIIN